MSFKLDENQEKRLNDWQKKIKELFGEYENYDYIFTPCEIGTVIKIKSHLTKTELDLSDVGNW